MNLLLFWLCLPVVLRGNLWDNLLSRLETTHHLSLPDSDQFEVGYTRALSSYMLSVEFAKSAHLWVEFSLDITSIYREPILTLGLDFPNLTLTVLGHTRSVCRIVQLPEEFEFISEDRNFSVNLANVHGLETLLVFATKFERMEDGMYVYRLGGDLLGRRTRHLQVDVRDYTQMMQLRSRLKGTGLEALLGGEEKGEGL